MKDVTARPLIREATLDDVPAIRHFLATSWLDTYPNEAAGVTEAWVRERWAGWDTPTKVQESRDHLESCLADADQLYRIAVVGNRVVALLHASRHTGKQDLGATYVSKEFQGTGLAYELFELANAFWDPRQQVQVAVVDYNARAKRFYEKQGFKKIDGSEYLHADKMPSIKMIREVQS
jgi:GNAT superfamily N-acetyltransferase